MAFLKSLVNLRNGAIATSGGVAALVECFGVSDLSNFTFLAGFSSLPVSFTTPYFIPLLGGV